MANHRNPVPSWLNESYLEKNLQSSFKDSTLKVQDIDIEAGSAEGDNYACQVLRIKVKLADKSKKLSIICKFKPESPLSQEFDKVYDIFVTEENFYNKVQPKINEITKRLDLPNGLSPKCLFVDSEHNSIFLEDLKDKGFLLPERGELLSLKQAELIFDSLATFHGITYLIVKEQPDITKECGKFLWGSELAHPLLLMMRNCASSLEKHLDSYNLPQKYHKKLLSMYDDLIAGELRVLDFQEGKLNFVCHGDCWKNNMMFRYEDNEAQDVILLDFQILSYNSFANDLQYFLFSSVDAESILNNLDNLLERYYLKLKEVAPEIPNLTLERVREEFFERIFFGFIMAVNFRPYTMSSTPPDLDKVLKEEGLEDSGFANPEFGLELHKLLPFFEKHGVFDERS